MRALSTEWWEWRFAGTFHSRVHHVEKMWNQQEERAGFLLSIRNRRHSLQNETSVKLRRVVDCYPKRQPSRSALEQALLPEYDERLVPPGRLRIEALDEHSQFLYYFSATWLHSVPRLERRCNSAFAGPR